MIYTNIFAELTLLLEINNVYKKIALCGERYFFCYKTFCHLEIS